MNIYLGNIQFDQAEEKLGHKLTEEDRLLWNEYYIHNADLSGKESGFHVFDIPRCIQFKGDAAKDAILKIFTPDKIVKAMGKIQVYQSSNQK